MSRCWNNKCRIHKCTYECVNIRTRTWIHPEGSDAMVEWSKALNLLQSYRCCPRSESTCSLFHLLIFPKYNLVLGYGLFRYPKNYVKDWSIKVWKIRPGQLRAMQDRQCVVKQWVILFVLVYPKYKYSQWFNVGIRCIHTDVAIAALVNKVKQSFYWFAS